jgi:hypothetical protein
MTMPARAVLKSSAPIQDHRRPITTRLTTIHITICHTTILIFHDAPRNVCSWW